MAKVLVLSCIDPRFTSVLADFLTYQAQVHEDYDLFALAGASLGVIQSDGSTDLHVSQTVNPCNGGPAWPIFPTWAQTFLDHVRLAISLHGITDVWVFDHLDCGAYKNIYYGLSTHPDTDKAPHIEMLTILRDGINAQGPPPLNFKGFIIDKNFNVNLVIGSPSGLQPTMTKPNHYIIGIVVLLFIYAYARMHRN